MNASRMRVFQRKCSGREHRSCSHRRRASRKGKGLWWQVSQAIIPVGLLVGTMQMLGVAHASGTLDFSLNTSESHLAGVTQTQAIAKTEAVDFQSALPKPTYQVVHSGNLLRVGDSDLGKKSSISLNFSPPQTSQHLLADNAIWTKPFSVFSRSIFKGGAESLVARVVGHAEGTRTVAGETTWAYWGHVDPGNKVWNRGTFSYQHLASSPEEADAKQLKRLKRQTKELERQAKSKGFKLSLLEKLNGIDLANQAPLAALDRGYIDWLAEAKQIDLPEEEAILWARTWAYWDPDLNTWNAPGLGNTRSSIEADQRRRQWAIAQVLHQCPRDNPTDCFVR